LQHSELPSGPRLAFHCGARCKTSCVRSALRSPLPLGALSISLLKLQAVLGGHIAKLADK